LEEIKAETMDPDHAHGPVVAMRPPEIPDYRLTGVNAHRAVEMGLAEADWYQSAVPRATMRKLLERRDGPAIRDTLLWFGILALTGGATAYWWGTWWAVIPYLVYAVFYGTASDSRWHECGHGTAFRTDWLNSVLYEIASFMVCVSPSSGAGATPATTAIRSSSAAIPKSRCRVRPT